MARAPLDDPRLTPIEQNLFGQKLAIARSGLVTPLPDDDVLAFHSEFPLVTFNFVTGATFAADAAVVRRRTEAVLDGFFERGHPFAWWPTPSTTSAAMEAILTSRGLEADACTGMYAELPDAPADPQLPDGLRVEFAPEPDVFGLALAEGNELPSDFAQVVGATYRVFRPEEMLKLVVRDGDEPVASGALYVTGATAGIYCLSVRPSHRRCGIGTAVVRVLSNVAGYQDCSHAIAHSPEESLQLFDHLGFDRVCEMPEYAWLPPLT